MNHHRFGRQHESVPVLTAPVAAPAANAFLVCPVVVCQACMGPTSPWHLAYQRAYECARAVVQPSILERLQAATLN